MSVSFAGSTVQINSDSNVISRFTSCFSCQSFNVCVKRSIKSYRRDYRHYIFKIVYNFISMLLCFYMLWCVMNILFHSVVVIYNCLKIIVASKITDCLQTFDEDCTN